MSRSMQVHAGLVVFSLVAAIGLFSLASRSYPDGILGVLQDLLQILFVLPYLVGSVLGGNAHSPSGIGFFGGLFIEVYALTFICWRLIDRLR